MLLNQAGRSAANYLALKVENEIRARLARDFSQQREVAILLALREARRWLLHLQGWSVEKAPPRQMSASRFDDV